MSTDTTGKTHLNRELSLGQASAINMIDMVGIGPFVSISIITGLMLGPQCLFAWLLGAILAYLDGMVWAELGARWPEAGGSYIFLQKLFGKWGRLMAFLFIVQTIIQAPLVMASASIGFSDYLQYLIPLSVLQKKLVSGGLIILVVILLYRNIKGIGKMSVVLSVITIGTICWLIFAGFTHFNAHMAFDGIKNFGDHFTDRLGKSTLKAVYCYLGYYNVCHLGAEIKNPQKNIPKSIFISVTVIAVLYLCMQTAIIGVLPWQVFGNEAFKIGAPGFVVSTFFEHIYNHNVAMVATVLILFIALASLFAVTLGYSRIPYAAARNGDFFPVFGKLHPRLHFPHISLLVMGALAFVFSLLFRMQDVISAIVTVRILIQFVSQAVGLIAFRYMHPKEDRPFKMPLFPLPAILSISIWLYILTFSGWKFILFALGIIVLGTVLFLLKQGLLPQKSQIEILEDDPNHT